VKNPVTILLVLVLVVAAGAISRVASTLDERRYSGDVIEELTYFPSGKFLEVADFGFDALIADVMWFRGIQYYGAHRKTDQAYPLAEHIFSTITDLDPQFVSAYRFGAIVLSEDVGATGAAIDLLRKGIRGNPETWEIPFDLGFLYFVERNDWAKAAHYFRLASRIKDSPEIAKRFTAFAYDRAGKTEVARALWEQLYASTGNRVIRDAAELANPDEFAGLAPLCPQKIDITALRLFDPSLAELESKTKINLALETERIALKDKRISNSYGASFVTNEVKSVVANSKGFSGEYDQTYCGLSLGLQAGDTDNLVEDFCYI